MPVALINPCIWYVQMCSKNPPYKANAPPKGYAARVNPPSKSPLTHHQRRRVGITVIGTLVLVRTQNQLQHGSLCALYWKRYMCRMKSVDETIVHYALPLDSDGNALQVCSWVLMACSPHTQIAAVNGHRNSNKSMADNSQRIRYFHNDSWPLPRDCHELTCSLLTAVLSISPRREHRPASSSKSVVHCK